MFHHGITAQEKNEGILPMRNADTSTIGLVVFSPDADNTMYPIDEPVLLTGITQDNIDKAGNTGTLKPALQTIRNITNPTVIILRVSDRVNPDLLDKLLLAKTKIGRKPKILGAPEIDTPVITRKLVSIAKKLRGFVYASPRNDQGNLLTNKADIQAYRNSFGDREIMLIENDWLDATEKTTCEPSSISVTNFILENAKQVVMQYQVNGGSVQTYSVAASDAGNSNAIMFWRFLKFINAVAGPIGGDAYFNPNNPPVTGLGDGSITFTGVSQEQLLERELNGDAFSTDPYEITLIPSDIDSTEYDLFVAVTDNASEPVTLHSCGSINYPVIEEQI